MEITVLKNTRTSPLNKHWQFCVGSGHATLALRADYLRQLKKVHDELGIGRVRFHGIFNDDMQVFMNYTDLMPLPGAEKLTQLSFRKIGMVYDNILACGMKPYVELSFMPKHLAASDDRCGFYYGGCIAPPKSDEEWMDFIRKFVTYLIGRYGKEEVESWPFEVWNEPDVPVFFAGTKEDYFHLYEITARAVKDVDDRIRVGGPAASGSKWVGSFMDYCKARGVPVDFISSHQYAGDPIGGVEASDDLEADQNPQAALPDPTVLAHLFDGLENGNVLDGLRRLMPDKSEFPQEFHGGFGLMTHSGIPKPQYYAMRMMHDLEDQRLDLGTGATDGEIGAAAFIGKNKMQVLLFRQNMKNRNLPKEKVAIRVEMDAAPKVVTLERIDEEHGNPLALWEAWGSPEELTAAQREEMLRKTVVEKETAAYRYENGCVLLEAELDVNDVYLFTIQTQ